MHPIRAIAVSALISIASAAAVDPVLLASRRSGWIEAINLETLETVSRLRVPERTESVASDVSGQRLFLTAPSDQSKTCCALFALDTQSLHLLLLVQPALSATIASSALFTQRGNIGIEVFDPLTLVRLPRIKTPGMYRLKASSDGRRLFGLANFPHPSLDLFDALQGLLIDSQPLPSGSNAAGAWLDQQFFLFTLQSGRATLWPINPDRPQLGQVRPLSVSGSFPYCQEAPYDMTAFAGKLVLYPQFGGKADIDCKSLGGFVIADPATGLATDRFDSNRFRQIVASPEGSYLYGLEVGASAWRRVQIVKMDSAGRVIDHRSLDPDVWYLTVGRIPQEMLGRMDLSAQRSPEPLK